LEAAGVGIASGLSPYAAATSVPAMIRGIMSGSMSTAKPAANLAAFEAAGTTPSVGQLTEGRAARGLESVLSKIPGGAGIMAKRSEKQAADIGAGVEDIASGLSKKTDSTIAGRTIEKGVTEDFIPKARVKQKNLYNKLDTYISPDDEVLATNSLKTLRDISEPIPGAPTVSEALDNKGIAAIRAAFEEDMGTNVAPTNAYFSSNTGKAVKDTMPYDALKRIRTKIGDRLSDFNLASDIPRSQLKRVYAALSQDMESAAKKAGPEAYAAFKRANNYTSALHNRIDLLQGVVDKAGGPEKIFQSAISGTREGATTLNAVMKALPEDGKKVVTSNVLRRLGIANPSAQNELGEVFSTQTFLTNWNKLSKDAKQALFGNHTKQFNDDINKIAKVASNLREGSKVFVNPSGTASAQAGMVTLGSFITALGTGNLALAGGVASGVGAANVAARAMTNPTFVRWLAKNADKPVSAVPAALNQLAQQADSAGDEDLKEVVKSIPIPESQPPAEPDAATKTEIPVSFQSEEGVRDKVYKDTTGNRTIGVGFNMDSGIARNVWKEAGIKKDFNAVRNGKEKITEEESKKLFEKSYSIAVDDARALVPNFDQLGENQKEALTHLAYQHGRSSLKEKLPGVLAMANAGNTQGAAARLLASDYGKTYKKRAKNLARMLYSNEPYS
jgi:GH24 family phage-related lysozyme (muramidase)